MSFCETPARSTQSGGDDRKHDAVVVQVNLAPQTLAMLMQNPNEMGKAITDDATTTDDQE